MDFLASLPGFSSDLPVKTTFQWLEEAIGKADGICYYKYPIVGVSGTPDLVFLLQQYQPIVVKCFDLTLDRIVAVADDRWWILEGKNEVEIDSPSVLADDLATELRTRFDKVRDLRRHLDPKPVVALPLCARSDFSKKFGVFANAIWSGGEGSQEHLHQLAEPLSTQQWRLARSVLQTAIPLTKNPGGASRTADTIGSAIKMLDADIALLDEQQNKVAIQIPPGPQRIRGLAGTGKTILLAMKAANIHHHFPDKKILLTFNTQSLYNQARNLVTRFYRFYSDVDPDWDILQIRHAWGGRSRPGVYYDLTQRQGLRALDFRSAKAKDPVTPFRACCLAALEQRIDSEYDYILVDEAQDFPKEFFPLLYKLSRPPHAIYWAYDELQSLASLEIPDPTELFGVDESGKPLVSLDVDEDEWHGPGSCASEVLPMPAKRSNDRPRGRPRNSQPQRAGPDARRRNLLEGRWIRNRGRTPYQRRPRRALSPTREQPQPNCRNLHGQAEAGFHQGVRQPRSRTSVGCRLGLVGY